MNTYQYHLVSLTFFHLFWLKLLIILEAKLVLSGEDGLSKLKESHKYLVRLNKTLVQVIKKKQPGPTGSDGAKGPSGDKGQKGDRGSKGMQGNRGNQSLKNIFFTKWQVILQKILGLIFKHALILINFRQHWKTGTPRKRRTKR